MGDDQRFYPGILSRADGVEAEILQEKGISLRRVNERFEATLAALREYDNAGTSGDPLRREELVRAASEALWYYVVQREVSGLRDTERLLDDLQVPGEVRLRMGVRQRPYAPISCQIHDRLLSAATLGREAQLEIGTEEGRAEMVRGIIEDVYTKEGAEYLRLRGGPTLRLDQIRSVDGHPVPPP